MLSIAWGATVYASADYILMWGRRFALDRRAVSATQAALAAELKAWIKSGNRHLLAVFKVISGRFDSVLTRVNRADELDVLFGKPNVAGDGFFVPHDTGGKGVMHD